MNTSNEWRIRRLAIAIPFLVAVAVITGTGCQKPPEAELAAAKKTLGEGCAVILTNDRALPTIPGIRILQLQDYLSAQ
ncbi:MAG: hypothetical protein AB1714_19845 [Acidobacteriota bacterium]